MQIFDSMTLKIEMGYKYTRFVSFCDHNGVTEDQKNIQMTAVSLHL